jgi:hypothetical protein
MSSLSRRRHPEGSGDRVGDTQRITHPDAGGSDREFQEIQEAIREAAESH